MAFVDVVGYGQLDEPQVAYFQQTVVPNIAAFLRALTARPMFVQIWGDALYLGFSDVREGGVAVLALRRFFAAIQWDENGFKKPLKLRIAIHSGPVMTAVDPFNGNIYFTGTVVSRAARIEPLTDEDQIFCSDAFAAIASALRVKEFSCAFAGTYLLPKNAGEEPLFRLLPAAERTLNGSENVSRRSEGSAVEAGL
jgi:class 3 adenylate cyclase